MSSSVDGDPLRPPRQRGSGCMPMMILLGVFAIFLVAGVGLIWWAMTSQPSGNVEEGTFLAVRLEGTIADAPVAPGPFDDASGSKKATPTEIARALRYAATDSRITGLYLEIDSASASYAVWEELRQAVKDFVNAGKPCVAYAPSVLDTSTYFMMTACPTVLTSPAGVAMVNGLAIEVSYLNDTLGKVGIEPEFQHVGDFKSAIETFERTGPSPAAAQAYEALLDSLYARIVGLIAEGREVSTDQVKAWIDKPSLAASDLVDRGMIDGLAWKASVRARATEVLSPGFIASLQEPVPPDAKEKFTPVGELVQEIRARQSGPGVAVVYASGQIAVGDGKPSLFGGDDGLTDGEFVRWMEEIGKDAKIKAVVIRVDSPGGSALASMNMREAILRLKATGMPIVISMAGYAASGGYLISADADWILAQPTTLTGSIGVFGGKFNLSGLYEKIGMHVHTFKRGDMAGLLSLSHGFTEAESAVFQGYLDDFYSQFVGLVADGRGMERDAVHEVAQGHVWTGAQALELGLVDELGGLGRAVVEAAERANLASEEVTVYTWPRQLSFVERFVKVMADAEQTTAGAQWILSALPRGQQMQVRAMINASEHGGMLAMPQGMPVVH